MGEKFKSDMKVLVGTFLAGASFLSGILFNSHYKANKTEEYLENNLVCIVRNQENVLGIDHFGFPKVKYLHLEKMLFGEYIPDESTIIIDKFKLSPPSSKGESAHYVLNHELGHFYVHKLSEILGTDELFRIESGGYNNPNNLGKKLISEGIAEYFARSISPKKSYFKDFLYPKTYPKLKNSFPLLAYFGGFHLVKPIIDKYGKKGIEHLIQNPPVGEEMLALPKYREKVMDELLCTEEKTN